jgi:hypothetical protein
LLSTVENEINSSHGHRKLIENRSTETSAGFRFRGLADAGATVDSAPRPSNAVTEPTDR